MKKIYIIGALAALFTACKPNVNVTTKPSPGSATFTSYLAVGSTFTAGFGDNALTVSGQINSYPAMLYKQFRLVGASDTFVQPRLHSDIGFLGPKLIVGTRAYCNGDTSMAPVPYPNWLADAADNTFTSTTNNGQINNIAVPEIRVVDFMVNGYASGRAYAKRFFHEQGLTSRPLDELSYRVRSQHPTFFTLWLGMEDVLAYALAGGQGNGTGNAAPITGTNFYAPSDISNYDAFFNAYDSIVNTTISISSSGALVNIPDITQFPFFHIIPANGLLITRQSFVDSLNRKWPSKTKEKAFDIGYNFFMVRDNDGSIRQSIPGELILGTTPLDSIKCAGWGSLQPIPEQYVITTSELQWINQAIQRFNGVIYQEARDHKLAYVDMNTYLTSFPTGYSYNGIKYTTNFISGGTFSLDGINPTPRGYALIANKIITTINDFYGATIPQTDVNSYPGIKFP